jgi:hypothetical protein
MGDIVAGRFEILAFAGQGSMARVYRAVDLRRNDTVVALKIATETEHLPRFTEEAAALSSLSHPSLVRYIAHGATDRGAYLAMEWIDGENLNERLTRDRLGFEQTIALGVRLARALGTAHAHGVLHRDVKPSNVMLRERDLAQPVLVDFGLAHRPGRIEVTRSGVTLGTLGYMSPEQVRGARDVDPRVDVFSLGCVLFRALAGRAPFVGNQPLAILAKILLEPTPRLRDVRNDVPEELDAAIARLMSPERDERPANGAAAATMLEGVSLARSSTRLFRERAIGPNERRFVSVIVVGVAKDRDAPSRLAEVEAALEEHHARVEPLPNGALVAMLTGNAMDQALRAGRAALELRDRFPDAAVALATGHEDVAAGIPIGPTIDRAVRFLGEPSPTGVRTDDTTAALLDARFEIASRDDQFSLERERAVFVSRKLLGRDTPFVGRDREMAMLGSLVQESARDRTPMCALVSAPAGTGKSRLRHELLGRIEQELPNAHVWIAQGDPLRAGSPFDIVGQLVCSAARCRSQSETERRASIFELASTHFAAQKLQRVWEFLAEIAGASADSQIVSAELRAARRDHELMRDQIKRAWLELLVVETRSGPRILVIDDLQWGDLASVRLIENALLSSPESPLCVLAFGRPDVRDKFPRLWADARVTEVRLGELTRRATEGLARDILGPAASPEIIARLVDLSGGNAFYLEELIRGVSAGRTSELPTSVVAMSESRLDELDPDLKRTLRAASVFGTTFWEEGIGALLGDARARAAEWLRNAEATELVHRRPRSRFPGQVEYAFRHALLREAALASLTEDDRAIGHALAAAWLEAQGETDPQVLAEHHERAGHGAAAVPYLVRLAEQALKATDADLVIRTAHKAKQMGASGEELGRVELAAAEAAMWYGASGVEHAVSAIDLLPEGEPAWLRAAATLAVLASRSGRHELHASPRERMVRVLSKPGPHSGDVIAAAAQMAFAVSVAFRDAPDLFPLLVPLRDMLELEPFSRAALEHALFMREVLNGRVRSGDMNALRSAIEPLDGLGGARVAHLYRANLAYAERMFGRLDDAERDFRLLEASMLVRMRMFALHNLGIVALMRGRHDDALRDQTAALAIVGSDIRLESAIRVELVRLHLAKNDLQAAHAVLDPFEMENKPPPLKSILLAAHAAIALAENDIQRATSLGERAVGLVTEGIDGESFVRTTYIDALLRSGRKDEAREIARTSAKRLIERAARLGDDGPALLALSDHAKLQDLARTL